MNRHRRPPHIALAWLTLGSLVASMTTADAAPRTAFGPQHVMAMIHAASVVVPSSGCTGVLAEGRDIVFTAHHCVGRRATVELFFSDGGARQGHVVAIDKDADQVILLLDAPVSITPLALTPHRPAPGTPLYFEGNPTRPAPQRARLDRVGRCPSLPKLPDALFTTIEGEPGDSGAPLVDRAGRVIGLVHGGAQCHIATPAATLRRLLRLVFDWEGPRLAGRRLLLAPAMLG